MTMPVVFANLTGLCGMFAIDTSYRQNALDWDIAPGSRTGKQENLSLLDRYVNENLVRNQP